jgi:hypothetical protein
MWEVILHGMCFVPYPIAKFIKKAENLRHVKAQHPNEVGINVPFMDHNALWVADNHEQVML